MPERRKGGHTRQHAGPPPRSPKILEEDLTTFLESEDVSSADQTAIQQDLKDKLQASLSSGSKPDFGKLKDMLLQMLFEEVKNKKQSAAQTQGANTESTAGATVDSSTITSQQTGTYVPSSRLTEDFREAGRRLGHPAVLDET